MGHWRRRAGTQGVDLSSDERGTSSINEQGTNSVDERVTTKRKGGATKWIIGSLAGLVVLVGGAYVASYFIAGNHVPAKASVDGVAIGGLAPDEAVTKLRAELDPKYAAPITVADPTGRSVEIKPLESGFALDYEAAVRDSGGGFSWNPIDIIDTFTGGGAVDLPKLVDQAKVRDTVAATAATFATEAKDATIAYEGTEVVTTESVSATELDADATATAVVEAFNSGAASATATLKETEPEVTTAEVEEAKQTVAAPAVSGPITITGGAGSFAITPEQIAAATTLSFDGGTFSRTTDAAKLFEATAEAQKGLKLTVAKDATYSFSGGTVSVVPSTDGQSITAEALGKAVESVITKAGAERTAPVEVTKKPAEFTTAEAEKVKPKEVIGEFTTKFPHAAYRNTNLGRAAASVNGTILMPGEIFSLNDTLGERTAANGYVDGYVINGGVLVKEPGGGISQSATTLYNAGFFAGYKDIEHKPHSLYFPRYPAGREATIYYGKLDMRFQNDTEYPAVIQGYVTKSSPGKQGSITFKIWSTRTYTKVTSTEITKSDYYTGKDRVLDTPNCEPQAPIQGFTARWKRLFYQGETVVKTEDYSWKYSAGDRITCA